jgi:hypothetical protein
VEALSGLEPHVPWRLSVLSWRSRCVTTRKNRCGRGARRGSSTLLAPVLVDVVGGAGANHAAHTAGILIGVEFFIRIGARSAENAESDQTGQTPDVKTSTRRKASFDASIRLTLAAPVSRLWPEAAAWQKEEIDDARAARNRRRRGCDCLDEAESSAFPAASHDISFIVGLSQRGVTFSLRP